MNKTSQKRKLTIEQMTELAKMTPTYDRPEIAKKLKVTGKTIWNYQKIFKLI